MNPTTGSLHESLGSFPGILLEVGQDGSVLASNGRLESLLGSDVVGRGFADFLDDSSRPKLAHLLAGAATDGRERWELVLTRGGTLDLRTFLVHRAGSPHDARVWLLEYVRDPEVELLQEELAGVNSDMAHTQRELTRERGRLARALEREQQARAAAERATERITALLGITEVALVQGDTDELLRRMLAVLPGALGADTATVLLLDESGQQLVARASFGLEEEVLHSVAIPMGAGVRGRIAATEEPLVLDDLREADVVSPILRERVRSFMGAPLRAAERLMGVIHVGTFASRSFTPEDVQFLTLVADRLAGAIERIRLYEAESEARQLADAAVHARDEVLGIVSHDLRNPLGTIFTSASLLLEIELPTDQQRRQLEIIRRAADRTNRLIRDLLEVTRSEAGGLSVECQRVDVRPLLAEVFEMFQGQALERGLAFELPVPPDVPPIRADRDRILQVFSNLIGNAVKFTPERGTIRVRTEVLPDGFVRFAVSDTGSGIDPADIPFLFERFWQARRTGRGGAGLGLAIAKAIVEAHGGQIYAESELGSGSTFWFSVRVDAHVP